MWGIRNLTQQIGPLQQALATPHGAEWIANGATIAWSTVTAQSGDGELSDGTQVLDGEKALVRGSILLRVTTAEVQKIQASTSGNAWTGGTFDATFTKTNEFGDTQTQTFTWDYDVSAADMQADLEDFYGPGRVTVAFSASAWTITYWSGLGNVTVVSVDITDITSGGTAAVTVTTETAGSDNGNMWGPYDGSATDGRQTLARGNVAILNETIKYQNTAGGLSGFTQDAKIVGLLTGGRFWKERLQVDGSGQPTLSALLAVMPSVRVTYGDQ